MEFVIKLAFLASNFLKSQLIVTSDFGLLIVISAGISIESIAESKIELTEDSCKLRSIHEQNLKHHQQDALFVKSHDQFLNCIAAFHQLSCLVFLS